MDETIRVRSLKRADWDSQLNGFSAETLTQVFEVYGGSGERIGIICESQDGQAYINGQPKIAYASLQAAATALMKSLRN